MPPFRLDVIKRHPNDNRAPKMLYCKKEYSQKVKVTDWNLNLESEPIDTDPYNPKCYRLHNSHYVRLGYQDELDPISESHETLHNGIIKSPSFECDPHNYLVNVYTYKYVHDCDRLSKTPSPKLFPDYITTMQHSYEAPYPIKMTGFAMPISSNQYNKHMGYREECKFSDDNFTNFTKTLQRIKGFRHVSFNPFTGMSTEGSTIKECSI